MEDFGSDTIISPRVRLILMDCFETLVQFHGHGYIARQGVEPFLDTFTVGQRIPVVVISDAPEAVIVGALRQAGLLARIATIHDGRVSEPLGEGRSRKRLDVPLFELGVRPDQAVFIGDSQLDAEAAQFYKVPFIRVPRSEDRSFSFARLIAGPSRYRSGEFDEHVKNEYRQP